MRFVADNWTVVVVGAWNRAILTPEGISRRLFGLTEGSPIQVEVPIDGIAPYRVKHDHLIVLADSTKITIGMEECCLTNLKKAMDIGVKALLNLPETPVYASGINVRFKSEGFPAELSQLLMTKLDNSISDAGYTIAIRKVSRSLILDSGHLNLYIDVTQEGTCELLLNFHRQSRKQLELEQ